MNKLSLWFEALNASLSIKWKPTFLVDFDQPKVYDKNKGRNTTTTIRTGARYTEIRKKIRIYQTYRFRCANRPNTDLLANVTVAALLGGSFRYLGLWPSDRYRYSLDCWSSLSSSSRFRSRSQSMRSGSPPPPSTTS